MTDYAAQNVAEHASLRDAFLERMLASAGGVFGIFSMYLGERLGLYDALVEHDALTSTELASHTSTHERYVREWLEQQTVAGILVVEDASADTFARRYRLPSGHAEVLTARDSLNYLAPLIRLLASITRPLDAVLQAYRTGAGVPLEHYGVDFREGQAGMNRTMFLQQLGTEWLPGIPDIHAMLADDTPARIADIGCGAGWSSIGIAQAYPSVQVDGYDLDAPSIELANANAAEAGLSDRVRFYARDAGDPELAGSYDLVTAFECVHDMSDPVGVLKVSRALLSDRGAVLIVDERVGDTFTEEGNEVEWMMYGWSVLHCLPVGMAEQPSAATGTVMRTDTLRQYARQAGFNDVEVLPIDNFFFRFYRLV